MITIISPAKNLNVSKQKSTFSYTLPDFLDEAHHLVNELRTMNTSDIAKLMEVNHKIAELTFQRYASWSLPFNRDNAKEAILMFNGEVYNGLKASDLSEDEMMFAQEHVRILSGLYGVLRPLDLIQPYRLEMGKKLETSNASTLYEFWNTKISEKLNQELSKMNDPVLINLASNEYFKSVKPDLIRARIVEPVFKELKGDSYKTIAVYAKKARGLMTRFIIQNKLRDVEQLKLFDTEGYFYNENLSDKNVWVFTR